jgi:hypothetical protein
MDRAQRPDRPFDRDRGHDRDHDFRRRFEVISVARAGRTGAPSATITTPSGRPSACGMRGSGSRVGSAEFQTCARKKETGREKPHCRPFSVVHATGLLPSLPCTTQRVKSTTAGNLGALRATVGFHDGLHERVFVLGYHICPRNSFHTCGLPETRGIVGSAVRVVLSWFASPSFWFALAQVRPPADDPAGFPLRHANTR